ncbi:MAG TPA: hypothetical protein VMG82_34130 [Candidatus Sulfotelmatobacter sp.]|nr:hypothetical protein [Candidatus Sulfotelmatobacter sp.]
MGNRRGLWIFGCLLLAGAIFWGVGQAVGPSGGDTELQKALDAMEHVKSFKGMYADGTAGSHSERLWEVDCNRVIIHMQSHNSLSGGDSPFEMNRDELLVGEQRYTRDSSGGWENNGYAGDRGSAKWYCDNIARGTVSDLMPDVRTMISHALTEKGEKKTLNGARCREWKVAIRTPLSAKGGSLCIGMDDHLPYEMTMDGGHYSYSDYNRPIQVDVPEAVLQPASSRESSN